MGKKSLKAVLALLIAIGIVLAGCSKKEDEKSEDTAKGKGSDKGNVTLKVGAAAVPHAEILEHIKPELKKEGVDLDIVVLDSEGELNPALHEKEIDANFFQHVPYLESVAAEKGYDFEPFTKVHVEPIGVYSEKVKTLDELKEGAKIGIPNNPSNEYRALILLEKNGLIKLKDGLKNYEATPRDIAENPKKLEFVESEPPTLARALPDVDAAVINTNVVLEAGIDPESALVREDSDSPYANIIVVRKGDSSREELKKLDKALTSESVKKFIKEKYGSAVVPAF